MLIRKAYEALSDGGTLIVYEAIIDDERRQNAFGLLMSLNMLIETQDAFDYTGADCSGWMKKAGFSGDPGRTAGRARFHGDRDQIEGRFNRKSLWLRADRIRLHPASTRSSVTCARRRNGCALPCERSLE
jgi:hypothetical protein